MGPLALGSYDLVHVRLLILVLSGVDPIPVIRRLASLLKLEGGFAKGGYRLHGHVCQACSSRGGFAGPRRH